MHRVKVTEVELPLKGLKKRVLEDIASPDSYNFEFSGGVRLEFPSGLKYYVWTFIPPGKSYTWYELETVAQQAFDKWAKKRGKKSVDIVSVGVEGQALIIVEAIGTDKRGTTR